FAAAGRLLPPSPYAADALSFARKVAAGQNIQQAALSTAGNAVLNRIQAIGGPPLSGLQARIPLLPKRLAGPAAFRSIVPPWRQWPQVQRELSETNVGELGESRAAVVCPRPSRQTASGFPRHQSSVTSLPRAEQEKIRASAQLILTSFQPGCQPILNVGLV